MPWRRSAKCNGNSSKKKAQEKSSNLNSGTFFLLKKMFSARTALWTRLSPFMLNSLRIAAIWNPTIFTSSRLSPRPFYPDYFMQGNWARFFKSYEVMGD